MRAVRREQDRQRCNETHCGPPRRAQVDEVRRILKPKDLRVFGRFLPSSAGSAPQPPFATLRPGVDDPPGAVKDPCLSPADADGLMEIRLPEASKRMHEVLPPAGEPATNELICNDGHQSVQLLSSA